jgi:hypothetical protein
MKSEERRKSEIAADVSDVYRSLARNVRSREERHGRALPEGVDIEPIADHLSEPLRLWHSNRKPTRTVPALVAYDGYVDDERTLRQLLVGLDVLVTTLDQFIDTEELGGRDKHQLGINVAFGSLLSFASIPDNNRAAIVEALLEYLVETARIPAVERAVQRELASTNSPRRAMELMQFVYQCRSRDISIFGYLPALFADVGMPTATQITADLTTYRAHYLLFDDIRDVGEDLRNDDGTPVTWLLHRHDDPDTVADRIATVYQTFDYSNASYRSALTGLERRPDSVRDSITDAMEILDDDLSTGSEWPQPS